MQDRKGLAGGFEEIWLEAHDRRRREVLLYVSAAGGESRMFGRGRKLEQRSYDRDKKEPVVRSSICTGERVAGFKDKETGKFEDILLLRTEADLEQFCAMYGVKKSDIKTIY